MQRAVDAQSLDAALGRCGDGGEPDQTGGQELHGQNTVIVEPPLDLRQSVRGDADLWSGQLSFAHEEKSHRSQRFKRHGWLVGVVLDKLSEVVEPVCDRIESERSEDGNDFFVRICALDLGLPSGKQIALGQSTYGPHFRSHIA